MSKRAVVTMHSNIAQILYEAMLEVLRHSSTPAADRIAAARLLWEMLNEARP